MSPPPLPQQQNPKLKKELCVFLIFLGVLLGVAGFFLYTSTTPSSNLIWGLNRNVAWGVPTLVIGALHLVSGLALAATSSKIPVIFGMIASIALAVFYFVMMVSSTGEFPINLITLVIIAIPALLIQRGSAFIKSQQE